MREVHGGTHIGQTQCFLRRERPLSNKIPGSLPLWIPDTLLLAAPSYLDLLALVFTGDFHFTNPRPRKCGGRDPLRLQVLLEGGPLKVNYLDPQSTLNNMRMHPFWGNNMFFLVIWSSRQVLSFFPMKIHQASRIW